MTQNQHSPAGIYIHIPFCDHKCIYCDFYSLVSYENTAGYLNALKKEIDFYAGKIGNSYNFETVFFGGGTPSFMETGYIQEILEHLKNRFSICKDAEITLETNPGTVNLEKLKQFKSIGINRLSVGIQSFNETDLKFLTRIHDKITAIQTVYDANEAGFDNISIDLIFNLPNQTLRKWLSNLKIALELPITHISAYSLILEKGTILNKMVLDGKVSIEGEVHDARLYAKTIEKLAEAGFEQYEVSNFAKPDFRCRHNNLYWHRNQYLGFGTSAHSFVSEERYWNFSSLKMYIDAVEKKGHACSGKEKITLEQARDEYIMLFFRGEGLIIEKFTNIFGDSWLIGARSKLEKYAKAGFLHYSEIEIKLTSKGYPICDEILYQLL